MVRFEIKRFIRNKEAFFVLGAIVIIFLFNFILEIVFYGIDSDNILHLGNLYNSFSQFAFLAFSPILGGIIARDYQENVIAFYSNNGISINRYFFSRIIAFSLITGSIFSVVFFVYCSILGIDLSNSMIVLLFILLNLLVLISYSCLLGFLVKNKGKTSMLIVFTWFIMSIINILPIKMIKGKLFAFDSNSYYGYVINNYLGNNVTNINFEISKVMNMYNLIELVLLIMITLSVIYLTIYLLLNNEMKKINI